MTKPPNQPEWRHLSICILLGSVCGGIASVMAMLAFDGLYRVSFALANQLEGWLAFGAFAVFLILSAILSGMLGGSAGGVVSGLIARHWWRPSRRWLSAWVITWMVGGLILGVISIQANQADPALNPMTIAWWGLMGFGIALAFAMIVPPWRALAAPAP